MRMSIRFTSIGSNTNRLYFQCLVIQMCNFILPITVEMLYSVTRYENHLFRKKFFGGGLVGAIPNEGLRRLKPFKGLGHVLNYFKLFCEIQGCLC